MAMEGPVRAETQAGQVWRYSFPNVNNYEGWAIIFLDSAGCFAALSDYGDWSYRWSVLGFAEGEDIRKFLLTCDDDYLLRKLGQGRKEYDPEGTLESAKSAIIEARRDDRWTKDEARDEWDSLKTHDELRNEFDFGMWYSNTKVADAGECHQQRYPNQLKAFIKLEMPRLREVLRQELKL